MLKQIIFSAFLSLSVLASKWDNLIYYDPAPEDIEEEIRLGEMELLAQLCMAEAGNQGLTGMRYVADVVLNRVDSPNFPNTVEGVIFQHRQFAVASNGELYKAGYYISDDAFKAAQMEWDSRLDSKILYFNTKPTSGKNHWKFKDHYFSY